jgi:hypothetical protein
MNTENIKLGPCTVTFNGVDLGATIGGVEVEVTTSTHTTTVDQLGDTVVNEYIIGRNCSVKVPLGESTLENLVALMPGSTLITDGVDPTSKRVDVTVAPGTSLLDSSQKLVLHPTALDPADKSEDFILYKANCPGELQFMYKLDEERVFVASFKAYPDNANNNLLFGYGDEDATP